MDSQAKSQASTIGNVSRRQFLRLSGTAIAALVAHAHLPLTSFAQAGIQGDVILMNTAASIDPIIPNFEAAHPGITLTRIDYDTTLFFSMLAAGTPPDLMRTSIPEFPQMYARNIAENLQSRFEASTVLREDDLAWPNDFYKASGALTIGEGDRYGMTNDFSPDFTLWIDLDKFEEMGIEPPSETEPLTYEQVVDLARQLVQFDGDRLVNMGFAYNRNVADRYWTAWTNGSGASLFSEDFTRANIVDNQAARDAIAFHFNLSQERLAFNPFQPDALGPHGEFASGRTAMVQLGFWYSGFLTEQEDEALQEKIENGRIRMIPAPVWQGNRVSPTFAAVGLFMTQASQVKDAAWEAFEWYMGEEPAILRAQGGAICGLTSLHDLIPREGSFRSQVWNVLQEELNYNDIRLRFNPYLQGGAPGPITTTYQANEERALNGEITFDELLMAIENETNLAIQEGIDRVI